MHDTASCPVGWNVHRFDIGMRWPICFLAGLSEWKEMLQAGYHFTSTIDLLLGTLFMSFSYQDQDMA
ncbi:MAG: hypothetical protein HWD58_02275 [Bacteroidota bacterium]|nr:MAG: hypothetical protein HWD58_02275 [Bacteroidota bacterium]